MTTFPVYKLTLHKTYYDKGFFNLGVDVERFVRTDNGPTKIILGSSKEELTGRVDRTANMNGTPRIFGGVELQRWFQQNCDLKSVVDVHIVGPDELWITSSDKGKKDGPHEKVSSTGAKSTRQASRPAPQQVQNEVLDQNIAKLLVQHGRQRMRSHPRISKFAGVKEYDALLNDLAGYPHAFVIACVMDRQIKAELAWAIPYKLKERIGDFEFSMLYKLSKSEARSYLNSPTPLHRFPDLMSDCLYSAIQIIGDRYSGDASLIWSDKPSSAEVIFRFRQIHGVGPKIATMAANILARNFGIKFKDYYSLDISADVHVKRVFYRLGLTTESPSVDEVISKARALHPKFPGLLDYPCWEVGRRWCRPSNPLCQECYLGGVCPSSIM